LPEQFEGCDRSKGLGTGKTDSLLNQALILMVLLTAFFRR
jgi:hypothetical protein